MKNIIYLILFTLQGFSASLTLNEAKDHNQSFSILHIRDSDPFYCEKKINNDFKDIVVCTFSRTITPSISKKNRDLKIDSYDKLLKIIPVKNISLYSLQDDFITSNIIRSDMNKPRKHWVVVSYDEEMELFKKSKNEGIDFDLIYQQRELPYIGSLDLDGMPVINKSDAITMRRIREAFANGNYEDVIRVADNLLKSKGNSYSQEAELYRLRAMDRLAWESGDKPEIDTDEFLEYAQDWINENPSSKHLPEVLMYISKTYYKLGHISKADEYADILNEEFYDNNFNKMAQIYKADRVYKNRKRRAEAIRIYKDVLYNTKDLTIASIAASKIAQKYLDSGEIDLGEEFYRKVVDANEPYIKAHAKESYEFAKKFADAKKYELAIQIVGILLSNDKDDKFADDMRKNIAYWYELSGDKEAAFGLYKQYLKDYPKGEYVGFVKSRLDKLLMDVDETNITKKMQNIDNILKKYPNDPVYKKALVEKAKILTQKKNYKELFEMEDALRANGGEKLLAYAAQKKIGEDLKEDNCKSALYLMDEYNVTVKPKYEPKLFECMMRMAQYKSALKIANRHIDDKELKDKLFWMYRALQAHSKLDHNKKVIMIGEDIEKLEKILNTHEYDDIVYMKAEAYYNLKEYDDMMLREVKRAQELFPNSIKNIDLFAKVLRYAKNIRDDTLAANYAKKIIELQKKHNIDDYSPMVEIDYINALKRLKQYSKALKEDLKLLYVKLTDSQRANVLYIAGELSLKLGRKTEAKEFFTKCGEIVENSSWQKLCAGSLELLEE